jgi:hypothetical protein|tara:strand:+ start:310 stop:1086 length:777 start_codon:yes stop_codon:yes gene_type:complete
MIEKKNKKKGKDSGLKPLSEEPLADIGDSFGANLFDYGEEPSSPESQSSKNEKVHTMELSFKGSGGEFQFHRLNKEEAFSLKKEHGDTSPTEYLDGGLYFENTIFGGAYGPDPDDMELSYDDGSFSGSDFASEDVTLVEENPEAGSLEYSYTTNGQVYGEIHIELKENETFDPEKLRFECVRYDLLNVNRKGRVITGVFYDGEECEIETSDNGQDVFPCLIGYFGWDSFAESPEAPIIYDPLEEMNSPDWEWLDKIFN